MILVQDSLHPTMPQKNTAHPRPRDSAKHPAYVMRHFRNRPPSVSHNIKRFVVKSRKPQIDHLGIKPLSAPYFKSLTLLPIRPLHREKTLFPHR